MAKPNYQRLKALKLMEILRQESDEESPLTKREICRKLEAANISCDPRTLARDIEGLNELGYEIMETMVGHNRAYYVADRAFSPPELKILIDAVQAASFITEKQTEEMIEKIAALGGSHCGEILKSNIVCFNTRKHSNKHTIYSVDAIEQAIRERKRVKFFYYDLDENCKKVYRKNRWRYTVDPIALVFNDDNYYLMTYHTHHDSVVNYRVDRMEVVEVSDEDISEAGQKLIDQLNVGEYTEQVFKMYNGEPEQVVLEFSDNLCGCVFDKFGEGVKIERIDEKTCKCSVMVRKSRVFDAWAYQFGEDLKVVENENVIHVDN